VIYFMYALYTRMALHYSRKARRAIERSNDYLAKADALKEKMKDDVYGK